MKSILRFIGAAVYGSWASWFLWLLVTLVNPIVMSIDWSWWLLLYVILYVNVLFITIKICSFLIVPFAFIKVTKKDLIIPVLFCVIYGFMSLAIPFMCGVKDFGFLQWALALSVSYFALQVFLSYLLGVIMTLSIEKDN